MTRLAPAFWSRPFAHRGLHDAANGIIENSHAAVLAAVNAGYGIEIDLQCSSDGEAMVFHDDALDRLTGETGPFREWTALDLEGVALSGTSDPIPTLEETLELVAGRVPLLIEVKDQSLSFGPVDGRLEARVGGLCRNYLGDYGEDALAVMSFNPHSVAVLRDHAPELPRGLVSYDFVNADLPAERTAHLAEARDAEALEVDFMSWDWRRLGDARPKALRALGLPTICWTIRSEAEAQEALENCDQITFEGFVAG